MAYHFQTLVISKRFELQQRDCAQIKALSKRIMKLTNFFELSLRKAVLWGVIGERRLLRKMVTTNRPTSLVIEKVTANKNQNHIHTQFLMSCQKIYTYIMF